ncbi:MAG: hypothetical protein U9N56_00040 [Actinomycetota bacterium]|nr:hypothetical protein [Actinomycetota bacterium]
MLAGTVESLMSDIQSEQDHAVLTSIERLQVQESDLVHKLERCVPPVDQHRQDLNIVRSQLEELRGSLGWE